MGEILKIDSIEKYYGNKGNILKAIDDVSFEVQKGEFVGVMGPSGSGKTTLLNVIATIDEVSSGHIYLNGKDLTEINKKEIGRFRRENLGFIFQDFNLIDTLTIHENIALALTGNKNSKAVKFFDKKIQESPNKEKEEVIADESQMMYLILTLIKEDFNDIL